MHAQRSYVSDLRRLIQKIEDKVRREGAGSSQRRQRLGGRNELEVRNVVQAAWAMVSAKVWRGERE